MPRKNGVQATAAITTAHPGARVIILTTFDYEDYVFEAIKAGAMGYLLKDVPADELASTIRLGAMPHVKSLADGVASKGHDLRHLPIDI